MIPTVPFKEAYFLEDALKFREALPGAPHFDRVHTANAIIAMPAITTCTVFTCHTVHKSRFIQQGTMNEVKWAIITGADGGMGTEITRAVATAGYHVIMKSDQ